MWMKVTWFRESCGILHPKCQAWRMESPWLMGQKMFDKVIIGMTRWPEFKMLHLGMLWFRLIPGYLKHWKTDTFFCCVHACFPGMCLNIVVVVVVVAVAAANGKSCPKKWNHRGDLVTSYNFAPGWLWTFRLAKLHRRWCRTSYIINIQYYCWWKKSCTTWDSGM